MARVVDPECERAGLTGARPLVLLHGLGRTHRSLWPVGRDARARGIAVHAVDYPSRRAGIRELARIVAGRIGALGEDRPLDFVTHSLGGILLRAMIASGGLDIARIGRVVMLGPPNQGSEVVDRLRERWYYRLLTGPAGQELGTGADSVPSTLPPIPFACGIIAGSRHRNPVLARLLPDAGDGKVTVARARADGMRDFITVPRGHTFLMWSSEVRREIFHFLAHGHFGRGDE